MWLNFGKWQVGRKELSHYQGTSLKEEAACLPSPLYLFLFSCNIMWCCWTCFSYVDQSNAPRMRAQTWVPRQPQVQSCLSPLGTLSTSASIHVKQESLYLDGTTVFWGLFVIIVSTYPKNSGYKRNPKPRYAL